MTALVNGASIVRKGSTVAAILGLNHATPGAIAAAAIVVSLLLAECPMNTYFDSLGSLGRLH